MVYKNNETNRTKRKAGYTMTIFHKDKYSSYRPVHHFHLSRFHYITLLLFLFSFLCGSFAANLFKETLCNDILHLFTSSFEKLHSYEIKKDALFYFSIKEHLKFYILIVFFAFTNVWHFYYALAILYTGFSNGMLFLFCTFVKGCSGVLYYLGILFPQCLLFVPFYLYALHHLDLLHIEWFEDNTQKNTRTSFVANKKGQLLLIQLPLFLLGILLLLLGSFLESYINPLVILHM